MKKFEILLSEIYKIQQELDYRTRIENMAIVLITQCRFDEALVLLDSI